RVSAGRSAAPRRRQGSPAAGPRGRLDASGSRQTASAVPHALFSIVTFPSAEYDMPGAPTTARERQPGFNERVGTAPRWRMIGAIFLVAIAGGKDEFCGYALRADRHGLPSGVRLVWIGASRSPVLQG